MGTVLSSLGVVLSPLGVMLSSLGVVISTSGAAPLTCGTVVSASRVVFSAFGAVLSALGVVLSGFGVVLSGLGAVVPTTSWEVGAGTSGELLASCYIKQDEVSVPGLAEAVPFSAVLASSVAASSTCFGRGWATPSSESRMKLLSLVGVNGVGGGWYWR